MKWRDAHAATLVRYGGRLPTEDEAQVGDVFVAGCVFETDDAPEGGRLGRWRVTVAPPPVVRFDDAGVPHEGEQEPGVPTTWALWDLRAHVADPRSAPVPIVMGLQSPRTAVVIAEALDRSRLLRCARAGAFGLARAADAVAREWRTRA